MAKNLNIGLVSSIVPKKCGIATFSYNLMSSMQQGRKPVPYVAVAAEEPNEQYDYDVDVRAVLKTNQRPSYLAAAKLLNTLNLDAVLLQHEFGLYGGSWSDFVLDGVAHHDKTGDYILDFLAAVTAPVITTLHTVLPKPDERRKAVIQDIAKASKRLVTMTRGTKQLLCGEYDIPEYKVAVIPHGVPQVSVGSWTDTRAKLGLERGATYLTVTGLIGPNKGLEHIINALPEVLDKHPDVRLLVVGQTHPSLLALEGEKYREGLIALAKKLGVCHAITFVNKYVSTEDLMRYLHASDIYLTIHGDPEQAASGTLAYAVGTGLAAISTPYRYAKELLANGRGVLVPFGDAPSIATAVNKLIENEGMRRTMQTKLKTYGQKMAWPTVARSYLKLIRQVAPAKTLAHEHSLLR